MFLARDGVERCLVVAGRASEAARVPGEWWQRVNVR